MSELKPCPMIEVSVQETSTKGHPMLKWKESPDEYLGQSKQMPGASAEWICHAALNWDRLQAEVDRLNGLLDEAEIWRDNNVNEIIGWCGADAFGGFCAILSKRKGGA